MNTIHYLNEEHILLFLLQVSVLLGMAKILGSLSQRWGYPSVAGEILAGILLGPTILGRLLPGVEAELFPRELIQQTMLETVSWFGVLFLLLATGFEVGISSALKQGKAALIIGIVGVAVPFAIGCAVFWWLPESLWGENANHLTFTLFLATAASISAIAVIAKILHDLEILKSDLGLTTLSGYIVNDLLGWIIFAIVLGFASQTESSHEGTFRAIFEIILFGTVCLTIGSSAVGKITKRLKETTLPHPATTLTFISCLAMMCGVLTQWIGIHAILGFFLAGVMIGNTSEISERTREIISQMIHAIFVPLFFASIGIKIDFSGKLQPATRHVFTVVSIGGKFVGAWIAALMSRMSRPDSLSIGIAFTPGGAMVIIFGMLALELKLIPENVFVAMVFSALSSSIAVGPLLAWSLKRRASIDIGSFLLKESIDTSLKGATRWDVIEEMSQTVASCMQSVDKDELLTAVSEREKIMGTGLEKGVAVPHGRLKSLQKPVVAFGKSPIGIDWDARDGLATHFVFMILTPEKEEGMQVQILAAIARCMVQPEIQSAIMATDSTEEIYSILSRSLRGQG